MAATSILGQRPQHYMHVYFIQPTLCNILLRHPHSPHMFPPVPQPFPHRPHLPAFPTLPLPPTLCVSQAILHMLRIGTQYRPGAEGTAGAGSGSDGSSTGGHRARAARGPTSLEFLSETTDTEGAAAREEAAAKEGTPAGEVAVKEVGDAGEAAATAGAAAAAAGQAAVGEAATWQKSGRGESTLEAAPDKADAPAQQEGCGAAWGDLGGGQAQQEGFASDARQRQGGQLSGREVRLQRERRPQASRSQADDKQQQTPEGVAQQQEGARQESMTSQHDQQQRQPAAAASENSKGVNNSNEVDGVNPDADLEGEEAQQHPDRDLDLDLEEEEAPQRARSDPHAAAAREAAALRARDAALDAAAWRRLLGACRIRLVSGDFKKQVAGRRALLECPFDGATLGHMHVHLAGGEHGLGGVMRPGALLLVEGARNMVQLSDVQAGPFEERAVSIAGGGGFGRAEAGVEGALESGGAGGSEGGVPAVGPVPMGHIILVRQ